jgi:hypothetical protein
MKPSQDARGRISLYIEGGRQDRAGREGNMSPDDFLTKYEKYGYISYVKGAPGSFARMKSVLLDRRGRALVAYHWAARGDWRYLANHIEEHGIINRSIRAFLVQVLRQQVARPNNRAPTQWKTMESLLRAMCVRGELDRGLKKEAAIDRVAEQFEIDRATVRRAWEKHQHIIRELWSLERPRLLFRDGPDAPLEVWVRPGEPDEPSPRYEIGRRGEALREHFLS